MIVEETNCTCLSIDEISLLKKKLITDESCIQLANFLKIFGDESRLKIISVLRNQEVCVCDLAAILGMTKSAVSHQLKILKLSMLVKSRRKGKHIFYSLRDNHIVTIFDVAVEHISE